MSGRGGGSHAGRRGRGPQPVRGRGGRGGRGVSEAASMTPMVEALSQEMENKLTMTPSTSTDVPTSQPAEHDRQNVQQLPPASSKALRHTPRPGFGTVGTKVIVKANHFLVNVAERDLTHYDVSIVPEVISKQRCRQIMNQLLRTHKDSHLGNHTLAYDGRKSAYSAGQLPFSSKDFLVKLIDEERGDRKEKEFKVSIKFASKADLHHLREFLQGRQLDTPQETIQFLDVVLREGMSRKNYEVVGRSFFSPKLGMTGELGNGVEYWTGFYQSLRPTQMGLSLNFDMSARAFFEPVLVSEFVVKHVNRDLNRSLSDQDRVKVKKVLKGVKVEVSHQHIRRRYKITGISKEPIEQLMFTIDDTGANISVVQYFQQKYKIFLKYPHLPAVQSGSDSKPVYLPMEHCRIVPGQRYSKKLNERQVSEILKANCLRPDQREKKIFNMVENNNYNGVVLNEFGNEEFGIGEFGIGVKTELTAVEARVLPAPMLRYHGTGPESRIEPRVGQWNMINKKMVDGGKVGFWTCINFSKTRLDDAARFCNDLVAMCTTKGMNFNARPFIPMRSANPHQIEKALYDIYAETSARQGGNKLQLLIVILPDASGNYDKIKRICETELGIVSQCCQPKKVSRYNGQYLENVSLKINVKVGGRNSVLELAVSKRIPFLSDRPTIIFGADVTHPPPGEDCSPSIAAVVASMDWPEVTKYRALVSAQAHREEMIQDLYKVNQDPKKGVVASGMIREHLVAFYQSTRAKPQRIIFYRDGVSEGQFNQVLLYEMDAIRKACVSLEATYMPRVTFVVVQKRHHTRIFPTNRSATDKSGNILAGTVIDTKICHPFEFDFYLCSHAGIQGTSRPAHYHVLYDENEFTADALQTLTNNLCYTYARCTRSVSIVPPAYYAHLAAFRARCYLEGVNNSDSGSIGGVPNRLEVRPLPAIKDEVKEVMFYC